MSFFDGVHPFYPHARTAFIFPIHQLVIILVFVVFAVTFLVILPGIRGRGRFYAFFRILISLFIGAVIVVVNFTSDWESGSVTVNTTYKSFSKEAVYAKVGLHIGLAGINVTLKGLPVNQLNETIDYNENFPWSFGLDYNKEYHEGLEQGLPNPILYIAEKFAVSSPCLVYLQYRLSGHFATAMMWVSFCAWVLANILFSMPAIVYGGYMAVITSTFMIFGVISFATTRTVPLCTIQFGPYMLNTSFSVSFWLTLVTALLCLIFGVIVVVMNHFDPEKLRVFFQLSGDDADDEQLSEGLFNNGYTDDNGNTLGLQRMNNPRKNNAVVYT
uniref:Numb-interacting protein 2 n=1 Tax=Callorhinchus milii TaxID=7868 RepID=V9KH98_CALMI